MDFRHRNTVNAISTDAASYASATEKSGLFNLVLNKTPDADIRRFAESR